LTQDPAPKEKEVIITASPLNAKDVHDTPYSADVVVGGDILERRLSRTTPEALKETPGVSVQKTGPGQGSPVIRGLTGYHTLMLIDGIRLNNSTMRAGPNQYWSTVDPFLIDRLEIVRGPSSVLYGSDSLGGTGYVTTKEPKPGLDIGGRTFYRFSSAERSHSVRQEAGGSEDGFGWFMGATYRDFNDIDGGRHYGEMIGTGYDEYDVDAKFVYRLTPGSKLVLAAQHHRTDDAARWHSTNRSRSWHGTTPGTDRQRDFDQERNLYYLQYHWAAQGGFLDAFRASLSWHRQAEKETRVTSSSAREIREFDVNTPALWIQGGKKSSIGYITAGAEVYRDIIGSKAHDRSAAGVLTTWERGPVADESTYNLWGIYVQDEFSIGALDVTPGIRFSRAEVEADDVDNILTDAVVFNPLEDAYQAVTGSLRLLYHLDENWNLIAGWGMGFRAPSLHDSTAIQLKLSGSLDLPAEGLDPEKSQTFDFGVRARYPTWEVSAFTFYTFLRDVIERVPAGDFNGDGTGDFTKDNFADGWIYGLEIAALYRLTDEVSVFSDWGYAKGEAEQLNAGIKDDQPIGKMNPSTMHLGARFEPKGSTVWVEGLATIVARQSHLSIAEGSDTQRIPPKHGTPGYTTYTVRGGHNVTEKVAITAAVENITNKDYRQHGSGVNEPGTNFVMGLDLKF
jgi:hemoglobin/transferrin/lactoferrin receptor protein